MTTPAARSTAPRRVALYSHDTQGLGHIRRNSLIARAITDHDPTANVLLLTGAREATSLPLPPRTEVVVLPGIYKDPDRGYRPDAWTGSLADTLRVRGQIVRGAVSAFAPDVFVVDKAPLGVGEELLPALRAVRGTPTRTVLGLRDVLDSPDVAIREWRESGSTSIVDLFYDEVWIYGDRRVYDALTEYALPASVAVKARFTGYLGHGRRLAAPPPARPTHRYLLCLVGGGQDGAVLAAAFARTPLPVGLRGVLVTGPYLPTPARAGLFAAAAARDDLTVLEFERDVVGLIENAAAVVTMGGYNTVCEVLAARRRALVVPRCRPRTEQVVRAVRLRDLGLIDLLDGEVTAAALARWVAAAVGPRTGRVAAGPGRGARPGAGRPVDLDGLARIPRLVADLADRARADGARVEEVHLDGARVEEVHRVRA